jgi:hypothetical protein
MLSKVLGRIGRASDTTYAKVLDTASDLKVQEDIKLLDGSASSERKRASTRFPSWFWLAQLALFLTSLSLFIITYRCGQKTLNV